MLEAATDAMLKVGIAPHTAEGEQQVANLSRVCQLLGEKTKAEPCDAMKGIATEGQKNLKEAGTNTIRDCLIGSSLTQVEHDEIVDCRGRLPEAQAMEQQGIVTLLQQNLWQEEQTAKQPEKRRAVAVAADPRG